MEKILYPEKKNWPELLKRPDIDYSSVERKVEEIIQQVRDRGDAAIF